MSPSQIDPSAMARILDVLTGAADASLLDLVRLGGLDPATDFANVDLRGWAFADQDVSGFDFRGADLRGTGIERAIRDETTILRDAILDAPARRRIDGGSPAVQRRSRRIPPGPYTMVRIPDLTSDELLERNFVIRDPLTLENLTSDHPPTDQWLTYEGRYDISPKVKCAFGHPHNRGYVFRDEDERRYLIGNSCGASHLGMGRWKAFAKERELLEERASQLRSVRDLRTLLERHRDWIAKLPRNPAVAAFDNTRATLDDRFPAFVKAVRSVSALNGRLSLAAQERDFAAEERERERRAARAKKGDAAPSTQRPVIMKTILRDAGELEGRTAFTTTRSVAQDLTRSLRSIDAFLASDVLISKRDLPSRMRNARELVSRIVADVDAVLDHANFFKPANLSLCAKWANENRFGGCEYAVEGHALVIRPEAGPAANITPGPPAAFDLAPLKELRDAQIGIGHLKRGHG